MPEGRIKVTDDVELETANQADIDYVTENFRDGDRAECEAFGGGGDTLDLFERCWVVRIRGKVVGYCGVARVPGASWLSPYRFLCFMSCREADRMKVAFVRNSRAVMRAVVERTPPWVETFLSAPLAEYRGTIIWHERVLGMHRMGARPHNGHEVVFYAKSREEILA